MPSAEKTILFHVGPDSSNTRVFKKIFRVVEALKENGISVGYVNEGTHQEETGEFASAKIFTDNDEFRIEENALPYAIQDLTGELPKVSNIPTLNEQSLLHIVRNKDIFHENFAEQTAQTIALPAEGRTANISAEVLRAISTEEVVVKPVVGHGAKGVYVGAKKGAMEHILNCPDQDFIVQERLTDSTLSMLKPYGDEAKEKFDDASHAELRLFVTENDIVPVAKLWSPKQPENIGGMYAEIDMDSIPAEPLYLARLCTAKLVELTGAEKYFLAVDMRRTKKGEYKVIEINGKEPARPNKLEYTGRRVGRINANELGR